MLVATVAAPVRQQVVEMLRGAITSGRFAPGQRLIEKDLCQLMGVSRASIREALRQLEPEGLIKNVPNRGPVVATLSLPEAKDIYQVRAALEGLAAKLFVAVAGDEEVRALRDELTALEAAYRRGEAEEILKIKQAFYNVILEGCGNKFIPPVLQTINARIAILRRVSLSAPNRKEDSLQEIRDIFSAIEKRDAQAAYDASMLHIDRAAEKAIESLRG